MVLASGGLTRIYSRNSASLNMGGDAYALALRAGAELIDMEFPQFFPLDIFHQISGDGPNYVIHLDINLEENF